MKCTSQEANKLLMQLKEELAVEKWQVEAAVKLIIKGYGIRYVLIVLIMLIIIMTKIMNPLVVFLGYMSLKVTALMQPITHKLTNYYFQETDPDPEPMPIKEEGNPDEVNL